MRVGRVSLHGAAEVKGDVAGEWGLILPGIVAEYLPGDGVMGEEFSEVITDTLARGGEARGVR